jgi:hypothetical protein
MTGEAERAVADMAGENAGGRMPASVIVGRLAEPRHAVFEG